MVGAIHDVLRWVAADRHLLLVIDDLQWADEATLYALTQLLSTTGDLHLDIAVAVREETGPWQRLVAEAIERNSALTVQLSGLRAETVAESSEPASAARSQPVSATTSSEVLEATRSSSTPCSTISSIVERTRIRMCLIGWRCS